MTSPRLDITGEKYSTLTAVSYSHSDPKSKRSVWNWLCDCGNTIQSTATSVRTGNRISCGCIRDAKLITRLKSYRKANGVSCITTLFGRYRREARRRGLEFELERNTFELLITQPCHYCGAPPNGSTQRVGWNDDELVYTGIDRKDSSLGYTLRNVVPCCKGCNKAKNNTPYEEFLEWIKMVHDHLNLGR